MSPRMLPRAIVAVAGSAAVTAVLMLASTAQAVDATIPAGGQSVTSLTPATGPLVLTPSFGGVVCPAEATQVAVSFYGGRGTGEILETDPALGAAYVIGEPARTEFAIERLAGQKGVATANLNGRYTYRMTCVNDFGVPIDGATMYYALVDVTPTAYTFVPPVGPTTAPTTTAPATTTTAPATTTTAPATTTTAPATTTTASAPTTTASAPTTTAPATTTTAPATTTTTSVTPTASATTTSQPSTTSPATTTTTTSAAATTTRPSTATVTTIRPGGLASTGASGIGTLLSIAFVLGLVGAGFVFISNRRQVRPSRRS